MNIFNRLYLILLAVFVVVMAGSYGYFIIFDGKYRFIDCLYMTVISITSVGYGEILHVTGNIPAQIFTMILITFGMGIILYGLSTLTALIIEGEISGLLRQKKMAKQISRLRNHCIVCGAGETGRPVMVELGVNGERVVLIEEDEQRIDRCREAMEKLLYVKGNAADDRNLIAAGVERAFGMIITLPSDKECLYVTMTARMLNRNIRIISRMVDPKMRTKLIKAGANGVVSPSTIGALRMASQAIRPAAVDFLDQMLRCSQGNLRIHQIIVSGYPGFSGKSIVESGLKDGYGLLVLGLKPPGENIVFNPLPSHVLQEGTTLIVMGEVKDIARARKVFSG